MMQTKLLLDGYCHGPLFAPVVKQRPLVRPHGKEGAIHRAQTRRRTPPWADMLAIAAFYKEAKRLTELTGELHVVDHIVPKCGKTVSGLHLPCNLQILHWRVNAMKSNNYWPDMWGQQESLL